ncbi:U-box domain-containing protein 4-like [Olea europaea var. sylvestris]|uniref:U-box domain-containing protein 4-like n=1 Tax=Olea europaea var. sylvestris TaxID=158386 RepID=UPI000C1D57B2|nr:U-box domain-containing protein 4-like [Olea europaea var. sylvestris]
MSLFFYGCFTEMMIYLMSQGMEISVLKSLLNSIASVFQLSSRESIKCEPVQKYHQKIEEMLKLLKPILDAILDAEIPKDEILQKEFAGLCQSVDNLREMFENWEPLMSKVYFVLQVELLMEKIRISSLEILELLKVCAPCLPDELSAASLEKCVQKIKRIRCGLTSEIITKAVKDHVEGSGANSECLAKISDILGLKSNQELLIEAVALEKFLLVNLLLSTDSKVQENAVTALLNLSINDNNKNAIANADAIQPLIHVLETGSPEAKENSAATLFSLSVIEENKIKIGRSGAIKPLVDLLGNGTPRGRKDAATALFNLSIFHENKARIVQAGAVKYLIELMDPATGMVDKAVAVLSNLATIHEGRIAIGQEGGIPVLVEVVELGSARGKENAAAALLQLCTNSSRFCIMVLREGAVPPLVALSQSGTPRAREKAQELLRYFRNQRHNNSGRR